MTSQTRNRSAAASRGLLGWPRRLEAMYAWLRPWRRFQRSLAKRAQLSDAMACVGAVDGLLSEAEAQLLFDLAAGARDGCIVEIGTFHGKSTVALALGARAGSGARVYAIDPFLPYTGMTGRQFEAAEKAKLLENLLLAGVSEDVWLLHLPSVQVARAWSAPIAFLWIDGDHSYEGVRADFAAWRPHVVPGGLVAFHDSRNPRFQVGAFLADLLREAPEHERVTVLDEITLLRMPPAGAARGVERDVEATGGVGRA